eukprot:TRINITY_DN147088_c0_g1_i1.p1 TRINITY_DN147088_c0_g1~~TRINITY_DN147088_c0_g1_i1.p1  ORF type:complete len:199 (+),score=31.55 TRINITY_DN147088_c0_g1_i1:75-671(+)
MFSQSDSLAKSVELINGLNEKRFVPFIDRVVQKVGKQVDVFSSIERDQLCMLFKLNKEQLSQLINGSLYIFETLQFNQVIGDKRVRKAAKELVAIGLDEKKIESIFEAWEMVAHVLVTESRTKAFGIPSVLTDARCTSHMRMENQNETRKREPVSILELDISNPNEGESTLTMEFNEEQLTTLFMSLEGLQKKLDSLT